MTPALVRAFGAALSKSWATRPHRGRGNAPARYV